MNTKKDSFNKASVLVALTFVLGTITYAWTGAPEGTPPANNVDAPVNVGVVTQLKSGALGIDGLFRSYGSAIFDGGVKISTDSGLGKILTSDAAGNASWTSTSSLGISGGNGGVSSFVEDSYSDQTTTRLIGSTYTNTLLTPRFVIVTANTIPGSVVRAAIFVYVNNVRIQVTQVTDANYNQGWLPSTNSASFIVPPGATYRVDRSVSNVRIVSWYELN